MTQVQCGQISFEITLSDVEEMSIHFTSQAELTFEFSVHRLDASGPTLTFATGQVRIDEAGHAELSRVGRWRNDVYISTIRLDPNDRERQTVTAAFKIANGRSEIVNSEEVEAALAAQEAFRNAEYLGEHHVGQSAFKMHVLLDKCFLDYEQFFSGGVLKPLNINLEPQSVIAAVNAIMPRGIAFTQTERLNEGYGREHPLCLVTFHNVRAKDLSDGVKAIQPSLKRIIAALGQNRGAAPEILAYIKELEPNDFQLVTPSNIYRGNLVHGFGPGVTPLLNRIAESGERQPWLDFLLNLMASVRQQSSEEAMLFVAWSLIESAAKRQVARGTEVIRNEDGAPVLLSGRELTTAKDLGRVMVYLRDHVGGGVLGLHPGNGKNLYTEVKLAYQCRNAIAHEGGIFRPGSVPPEGYTGSLPFSVRDWASTVVGYECNLPNGEEH